MALTTTRWSQLLRLARRVHLYFGLAMLPWVALYAISGFLFNHPWAFDGDHDAHQFGADAAIPGAMEHLVDATTAADAVIDAIAVEAPAASVVRTDDLPARFERSLSATAQTSDGQQQLFIDVVRRSGVLSRKDDRREPAPDALTELSSVTPEGVSAATFDAMAAEAFAELGVEADAVEVTGAPRLRFSAEVDGERWLVTYQAQGGKLVWEPAPADGPPLERLLAKLHMTHVYPATLSAAWVHTFIVDLVAVAMLLWVVTGTLMWWQMRRLRRVGTVVLTSATIATLWLLAAVVPGLLH